MNFFPWLFQSMRRLRENAAFKAAAQFGNVSLDQFELLIDEVQMADKARDPLTGNELSGLQKSSLVAQHMIKNREKYKLPDEAVEWMSLLVKLAWAVARIRRLI